MPPVTGRGAVRGIALLVIGLTLALGAAACGGSAGDRTVPDWMLGKWQVIRINNRSFAHTDSYMKISQSSVEFHLPGCDTTAQMTTDWRTHMFVGNPYTLTFVSVACPTPWDFTTNPGLVDTGVMWGEIWDDGRHALTRVSSAHSVTWVYARE